MVAEQRQAVDRLSAKPIQRVVVDVAAVERQVLEDHVDYLVARVLGGTGRPLHQQLDDLLGSNCAPAWATEAPGRRSSELRAGRRRRSAPWRRRPPGRRAHRGDAAKMGSLKAVGSRVRCSAVVEQHRHPGFPEGGGPGGGSRSPRARMQRHHGTLVASGSPPRRKTRSESGSSTSPMNAQRRRDHQAVAVVLVEAEVAGEAPGQGPRTRWIKAGTPGLARLRRTSATLRGMPVAEGHGRVGPGRPGARAITQREHTLSSSSASCPAG